MVETTQILAQTDKGFIVWDDIQTAIERYKLILPNPEYLNTKSITFEGLIRYIHTNVIRPIIPESNRNDYKLLDDIFNNIYIPLCNIYGFQPNIILFCLLCDIDYSNIGTIAQGRTSSGAQIANRELQAIVQKWRHTCESGLYSNVSNHSSIGSMFLLKSVYGYQEQQTIRIETDSSAPRLDTKQLQTLAQTDQEPQQITENNGFELPPDD